MATAVAAAAVLLVPVVAGTGSLAETSTTTSTGGISIVASSSSQSSTDKASETAGVADATVAQQPATIGTVEAGAPSNSDATVGPRGAGTGTAVRSAAGGSGSGSTGGSSNSTTICPSNVTGTTETITTPYSTNDVEGTTSDDIATFAATYNSIRVANCLAPIPLANFHYDSCLQARIFWMADDPSSNPASAWGHTGTAKRSDGLPIVGCDGDLDGGMSYTGATVATDWWNSEDHRDSLYQPLEKGSMADVCITFAMTHGGYNKTPPNEPITFVRAIANWGKC